MSSEVRENLSRGATWIRGLYMLLFAVIFNLAELVLAAAALFQFVAHLLTGVPNQRLRDFGGNLSTYLKEIADFLTYSSADKPFPFAPWPGKGGPERDYDDEHRNGESSETGEDEGGDEPNEAGVR